MVCLPKINLRNFCWTDQFFACKGIVLPLQDLYKLVANLTGIAAVDLRHLRTLVLIL
jgi:hypothetical protein